MSIMINDPDMVYFHTIREGTRNEYLSAGSDGRVLRWGADGPNGTPSDNQKWFISALPHLGGGSAPSQTRYRIQNVGKGGFLHVGDGGFYWTDKHNASEDESTFTFELTGVSAPGLGAGPFVGWLNMREYTRGEFVAIGGNGWSIRWGATGNEDQRFYLERSGAPHALTQLPALAALPRAANELSGAVDQIPDAPYLTGPAANAAPGPDYLVAEQVLPSALIRDRRFGDDPLAQARVHPWYRFRHVQRYEILRGSGQPVAGQMTGREAFKYQVSARRLFRKEDLTTITDTFSWNVSGEVTGEVAAQKGASDQAHKKGGGTAKLAFSVSKTLEHLTSSGTIDEQETIVVKEMSFEPQHEEWSIATYALLNIYTLTDSAGAIVHQWEVFDTDRITIRGWPRLPAARAA